MRERLKTVAVVSAAVWCALAAAGSAGAAAPTRIERARALQAHKLSSLYTSPRDYVFASQVETPLYWRNVARRALHPALKNAGIEHLRWHGLRHTYASLLIAQGANIVYVSRQLEHGSSDITLRCYSHLFDRAEHAVRTRDALEHSFGELL